MTVPGNLSSPLLASAVGAAGPFEISRSLRFNSADSAYLNRTPSSAGNRRTWTWSCWIKRNTLDSAQNIFVGSDNPTKNNTTHSAFYFHPNNKIYFGGWNSYYIATDAVYRDVSAWYHIVLSVDTSQSTATDRIKVYVNNVLQSYGTGGGFPGQNTDLGINQAHPHYIGGNDPQSGYASHMYAEVNFVDGSALDPTSFGQADANGVWQAKDTAGLSFGTNGFRLKFADNSGATATTLGKDTSGNSNNWTPNNLSVSAGVDNDSFVDTPTNGDTASDTGSGGQITGNYATWNPLDNGGNTLKDGNLVINGADKNCKSTIAVSSGKWYFEQTGRTSPGIALASTSAAANTDNYQYQYDGNLYHLSGGGYTTTSGGASFGEGDIIGVALDLDNNQLKLYKNGALQSALTKTIAAGTYCFMARSFFNTDHPSNFGQRAFAHTAPSGYKSLNTANLTPSTIADGSQYFDTKLWTGTGSSRSVAGYSFSPDWVWIKKRSGATSHNLFDVVRGANKPLFSDQTNQELSDGRLTAFNSDGFTLDSDNAVNDNNQTHVGWAWDAGTSTVSNTDGTGTTNVQVRANPSAGFSIVTYTGGSSTPANSDSGDSFGHGLGVAPQLVICKKRTGANSWPVYHASTTLGALVLDGTNALDTTSFLFAKKHPTNSVVYLGNNPEINNSSHNYVAYCFVSVEGYSAVGSYQNPSSSDGAFVHLGFRPAFLLIRCAENISSSSGTGDWLIKDTTRSPFNNPSDGNNLVANVSAAEDSHYGASQAAIDILSNGFKIRHPNSSPGGDTGRLYVFYAVAENPFQANGGLVR